MSIVQFKAVRDFSRIPMTHRKLRFSGAEIAAFDAHGWFCHYCMTTEALSRQRN